MNDVLGEAMWDYYHGSKKQKLWIHNTYGRKEEMPISTYFRTCKDMPFLERRALKECKGNVLDVGAGAGAHALTLQEKNKVVTALEISPKAIEIMKKRGVANTVNEDILNYKGASFETILLLMNGIGITGSIAGLKRFLDQAKNMLTDNGQLLFDSSDVAYLYKGKTLPLKTYYGEINFQYEYKNQKGDWFTWLYIDRATLFNIASKQGWTMRLLEEDEYGQYLVRLTPAA